MGQLHEYEWLGPRQFSNGTNVPLPVKELAMMHELDFQRVTGRLEGYTQARIEQKDRVRKFKLALFWILTGTLAGTLFGIGFILTERAHF